MTVVVGEVPRERGANAAEKASGMSDAVIPLHAERHVADERVGRSTDGPLFMRQSSSFHVERLPISVWHRQSIVDGLDESFLFHRLCARTRITSDMRASVQSVHLSLSPGRCGCVRLA